jgi:hypothetical protein
MLVLRLGDVRVLLRIGQRWQKVVKCNDLWIVAVAGIQARPPHLLTNELLGR